MNDLTKIALYYHYKTESFDRIHCKAVSPRTGNALPASYEEASLCSRNAASEYNDACKSGRDKGFSSDQIRKAIQETAERYSYQELVKMFYVPPGMPDEFDEAEKALNTPRGKKAKVWFDKGLKPVAE